MFLQNDHTLAAGAANAADLVLLRTMVVDHCERRWPSTEFVFDWRFCEGPMADAEATCRALRALGIHVHPRLRADEVVVSLDLQQAGSLMEGLPDLAFGPDGESGRDGWRDLVRGTPLEVRQRQARAFPRG